MSVLSCRCSLNLEFCSLSLELIRRGASAKSELSSLNSEFPTVQPCNRAAELGDERLRGHELRPSQTAVAPPRCSAIGSAGVRQGQVATGGADRLSQCACRHNTLEHPPRRTAWIEVLRHESP